MANKITVDVRMTREPEPIGLSAKGVKYLPLKGLVEDTQDGPKWFDAVVFGAMAEVLRPQLKKGMELRLDGDLTVKEFTRKDGGVGTGNSLVVRKVTLEGGKVVDKFTPTAAAVEPSKHEDAPF